ncbi:MAG: glycosyltransferase family 4 protein [Myxococcales bacterium]|nr:glycosyltransferase family 4 protein [Myxococcales bacterium]
MRLAYLSHYFPPETNAPAARVHELSRALVDDGHSVHVITGQPNHPRGVIFPGYRAASVRRELIDGITVHRLPTFPAANRGVALRSLGFMLLPVSQVVFGLTRVPEVDCVFATSPQLLTGVAGLALARARRRPFVLEVRDLWPESIVSVGALPRSHPIVRGLERVERGLYHSAAGIVSVTESFVEHFEAHGVPRARVDVIKNGIDARLFDPTQTPAPLRERLGIVPDALLVLFCGTIGMAHDVGLLARAIAASRGRLDAHVVIVGDGAQRDAVAREIAALDVSDRVHLLPPVAREEVPALLAAADLSAVILRDSPTFAGVLPSKMFEAMAMRCPIVLGVRGEASALLERAGAGLAFTPGDVDALVSTLQQFRALPPARRRELGERGRAFVLAHHDRRAQARALARFLERTIARAS